LSNYAFFACIDITVSKAIGGSKMHEKLDIALEKNFTKIYEKRKSNPFTEVYEYLNSLGVPHRIIANNLDLAESSVKVWSYGNSRTPPKREQEILEILGEAITRAHRILKKRTRTDAMEVFAKYKSNFDHAEGIYKKWKGNSTKRVNGERVKLGR
jgi:hypothetical protein